LQKITKVILGYRPLPEVLLVRTSLIQELEKVAKNYQSDPGLPTVAWGSVGQNFINRRNRKGCKKLPKWS